MEKCYTWGETMADVLAVRDEYRAQSWAMVIRECQASGLSNREFCRQRGIAEKTFYYWLRKLREQAVEAAAVPELVPLEESPVCTDMLNIRFRGSEISVPGGVDMEALASLLRSIQRL